MSRSDRGGLNLTASIRSIKAIRLVRLGFSLKKRGYASRRDDTYIMPARVHEPSPSSKIESLKTLALFTTLTAEELRELAAAAEIRTVRKGACVLRAAEPGHFMMFVLSGRLAVQRLGHNGREFTLDTLEPGDFFGELALLTDMPRAADVRALEGSTILILAKQEFERLILGNNLLVRTLLRQMAERFRAISVKAGDVVLFDVCQRLLRVLHSLSEERSVNGELLRVVDHRPTHRELAALAGTTREVTTKALKELADTGQIVISGRKILLRLGTGHGDCELSE